MMVQPLCARRCPADSREGSPVSRPGGRACQWVRLMTPVCGKPRRQRRKSGDEKHYFEEECYSHGVTGRELVAGRERGALT